MKKATAAAIALLSIAFAISPAFTARFSGFTPDQLPIPQVDPPIQPAGYAFAIWGVIYLWLIVSALFGLWKRAEAEDWHRARKPLMISLLIGVPWIAIATNSAIWATITIVLMALGAIAALIAAPSRDRWWFQAPVALYAGWLTAASWVSIATTSAGYGLFFTQIPWAVAGIACALIVALMVLRQRPSAPEYVVSIIWALIGIVVANGTALPMVSGIAVAGAVVLSIAALRTLRRAA